jgi:hypothetical protein
LWINKINAFLHKSLRCSYGVLLVARMTRQIVAPPGFRGRSLLLIEFKSVKVGASGARKK